MFDYDSVLAECGDVILVEIVEVLSIIAFEGVW